MSEKTNTIRVKNIMSRDVVVVSADDTVHTALELLVSNRVSVLPVIDKRNHCIGILSTTDLVDFTRDVDEEVHDTFDFESSSPRWLVDQVLHSIGREPVASYMTEDVAVVTMECSIRKAAREMVRNRVHHLPVIDHHNQLVGIISTMDILAEFADGEDG